MFKFLQILVIPVILSGVGGVGVLRGADFDLVGREMLRALENGHYARLPADETLGLRILERYLYRLDPERLYFSKEEVGRWQREVGRNLPELIFSRRAMEKAREIFEIFRRRVKRRVVYSRVLLKDEFPFDGNNQEVVDRSEVERPANEMALMEVWKGRVTMLLLNEKLERAELMEVAAANGEDVEVIKAAKKSVEEALVKLDQDVTEMDEFDVAEYFLSAVAQAYCPDSDYMSPSEKGVFDSKLSGELVGVGIQQRENLRGEIVVVGIVRGGPADRQGQLQLGDRIVGVDQDANGKWVDIRSMADDRIIELILGEIGRKVGLRVLREVGGVDREVDLVIERGLVTVQEELAKGVILEYYQEGESLKIGVIEVPSFYFPIDGKGRRVSGDVERLLRRMKKEKVKGVILDLRDNGGGAVSEAARMTGLFVGSGPVVLTRAKMGALDTVRSSHRKPFYEGAMVVLLDRNSASASEIVAAALQDYGRAVLVGSESTYGKGTMQNIVDIEMPFIADTEGMGDLKLTSRKYYRVTGRSVQLKGVKPDIVVPDPHVVIDRGAGASKYALAFDLIDQSAKFKKKNFGDLHLDELKERSESRIQASSFFRHQLDEMRRELEERETNKQSMNFEDRMVEVRERRELMKAKRAERRVLMMDLEDEDRKRFQVFRLNLDDAGKDRLPLYDVMNDGDEYVRKLAMVEGEVKIRWPNGLDGVEREGLQVLWDLFEIRERPDVEPEDEVPIVE